MTPIICWWKLVNCFDCFGDDRRTKDTRKIKLFGLNLRVLRDFIQLV